MQRKGKNGSKHSQKFRMIFVDPHEIYGSPDWIFFGDLADTWGKSSSSLLLIMATTAFQMRVTPYFISADAEGYFSPENTWFNFEEADSFRQAFPEIIAHPEKFQDPGPEEQTPEAITFLSEFKDDEFVDGKVAARLLGLGYNRFNEQVRKGEIDYEEHDGRGRRYRACDLRAYLESRIVKVRPAKPLTPARSLPVKRETKSKKTPAEWREEMKTWKKGDTDD